MVANPLFDLLAPVCSESGGERDPTVSMETSAAAAEQELSEELGGKPLDEDLGAVELPDEYGDWKDDFADAVCVSRWREL